MHQHCRTKVFDDLGPRGTETSVVSSFRVTAERIRANESVLE